jgi:hypothetical protein
MPRFATYPTLFDDCKTLKVSDIVRWGYLKPNQHKTGTVTWSSNGNKTASISIAVNFQAKAPYLQLEYSYNGTPLNYIVQLVSAPSNLGKGAIWYFICPHTRKRCRKLHLIEGYFFHRSAFKGCFYSTQVQSKFYRFLENTDWAKEINIERLILKAHEKHFKKQYAGKPTKRYLKIQSRIKAIQNSYTIPFD